MKIVHNLLGLAFCLCAISINAQTTLPTAWNFSSPGISTPPDGWYPNLGTNGNLTYSGSSFVVGPDAYSCRFDATQENVEIWFDASAGPLSYYIRGTGISPNPPFSGTFKVQESTDGSVWNDLRIF